MEFPPRANVAERHAGFELHCAALYPSAHPKSEHTAIHFDQVCSIRASGTYLRALKRWKGHWIAEQQAGRGQCIDLGVAQRLLVGLSNTSLWDSSITINPTYGVPVVPGSAIKGLARSFAMTHLKEAGAGDGVWNALFGTAGDAGEVGFQDAWWMPGSGDAFEKYGKDRAFVREVVTPHHKAFLDEKGRVPATPFDSPTPIPQLATHGRFLFVASGPAVWAMHALDVVRLALEMEGIGARTPEYGTLGG